MKPRCDSLVAARAVDDTAGQERRVGARDGVPVATAGIVSSVASGTFGIKQKTD